MRRLSFLLLLVLGACATTQQQINSIVSQVQADAKAVCGFEPQTVTILNYINAAFGTTVPVLGEILGPATSIANAICGVAQAVPPITPAVSAKLKANPAFVTVNGQIIVVHGTWVRGPNAGKSL